MNATKLSEPRPRSGKISGFTSVPLLGVLALNSKFDRSPDPLDRLLRRRTSTRRFRLASPSALAQLLWLVQGGIGSKKIARRYWPSPGALQAVRIVVMNFPRHPLDAFLYIPGRDALGLFAAGPCVKATVRAFSSVVPIQRGTLLWFLGDVQRYESKYVHPETLMLKEAGVLTAAVYLAAAQLDMACCAIGRNGVEELRYFGQTLAGYAPLGAVVVGAK